MRVITFRFQILVARLVPPAELQSLVPARFALTIVRVEILVPSFSKEVFEVCTLGVRWKSRLYFAWQISCLGMDEHFGCDPQLQC